MTYFAIQREDNKEFYQCSPWETIIVWNASFPCLFTCANEACEPYNRIRELHPGLKIHLVSFTLKVEISST